MHTLHYVARLKSFWFRLVGLRIFLHTKNTSAIHIHYTVSTSLESDFSHTVHYDICILYTMLLGLIHILSHYKYLGNTHYYTVYTSLNTEFSH